MTQAYQKYKELTKRKQYRESLSLAEFAYLEGDKNNPFWLTRQAAALIRMGNFDKALEIAKQALSLQPSNQYSIFAVAQALLRLNRTEEARHYFEDIVSADTLSKYAKNGVLNCLAIQNEWHHVFQYLQQWEFPDIEALSWKTRALFGLERLDDAIESCKLWIEKAPDNPSALWMLTELEIKTEGLEPVLSRMGKIARIPSRPSIYKEIYASLLKRAGKHDLAVKQYEKLTSKGASTRIQRKQAFALAKSGKELEAIPIMEELLKQSPKDFYVHSAYGGACKRVGQQKRAIQFYNELIKLHPEEKSIYGRLNKMNDTLNTRHG